MESPTRKAILVNLLHNFHLSVQKTGAVVGGVRWANSQRVRTARKGRPGKKGCIRGPPNKPYIDFTMLLPGSSAWREQNESRFFTAPDTPSALTPHGFRGLSLGRLARPVKIPLLVEPTPQSLWLSLVLPVTWFQRC